MNLYNNVQITGPLAETTFRKHPNDERIIFCQIGRTLSCITMEATHIRALAAALDAWEADQAAVLNEVAQ